MSCREAKRFNMGTAQIESLRTSSERDYRLDIKVPYYREWEPGQFVMLRWGRHLVGRPFAIVDWKAGDKNSLLSVWIRRLGFGTEELALLAKPGFEVQVTAPLGNGFDSKLLSAKRLILLSGGVGAASILPLVLARGTGDLWIHGEREESYLDRELASSKFRPARIFMESLSEISSERFELGRITDGIRTLTEAECADIGGLVACGPSAMLEAVAKEVALKAPLAKLPLYLGLEERMGCGVGLCFSCSVWTNNGMKRLCTEGPWFEASEIPEHFACRKGGA